MKHMISLFFPEYLHHAKYKIEHENSIPILSSESASSLSTPANLVFGPSTKLQGTRGQAHVSDRLDMAT